jgi:hypothetical protein
MRATTITQSWMWLALAFHVEGHEFDSGWIRWQFFLIPKLFSHLWLDISFVMWGIPEPHCGLQPTLNSKSSLPVIIFTIINLLLGVMESTIWVALPHKWIPPHLSGGQRYGWMVKHQVSWHWNQPNLSFHRLYGQDSIQHRYIRLPFLLPSSE